MKRKMHNAAVEVTEKRHYKMFKKGKHWLVAGITTLTVVGLAGTIQTVQVHAAETAAPVTTLPDSGGSSAQSSAATSAAPPASLSQAPESSVAPVAAPGSAVTSSATSSATSSSPAVTSSADMNRVAAPSTAGTSDAASLAATPAPVSAASSATQTTATVASLENPSQASFASDVAAQSSVATPTSVTVAVPDQVANKDSRAAEAKTNNAYAEVSDWAGFATAYNDASISYVKMVNDIVRGADTTDLDGRTTGMTLDGAGHALDMGDASFVLDTPADPATDVTTDGEGHPQFTVTDIQGLHQVGGPAVLSGDGKHSVIELDSSDYGKWVVNVDNVVMTDPDVTDKKLANHAERFVDAEDTEVNFSGDNKFYLLAEVGQVGAVHIADGATVDLERTAGTAGYSMFYFMSINGNDAHDSGHSHEFIVGDGATITAKEYAGCGGNDYPVVYFDYSTIKVGDNVTWTQDGFHNLLDTGRGTDADATVTFGQNLNMTATNVRDQAIVAHNGAQVTFNAGTVLDLVQQHNSSVIDITGDASVNFISPKSLHMTRLTADGDVAKGALFSGTGTFTMHNSEVDLWDDDTDSTGDASQTHRFTTMTVTGKKATLVDAGGATQTVDVADTRELKTTAIGVGTIMVNYVDAQNQVLGTKTLTLDGSHYIGQLVPLTTTDLVNQDMPAHYHWALAADQMTAQAQQDAQSKGDSSSRADDGDALGQANYAVVPMAGETNVYNIYVYGDPERVDYAYVDVATGDELLPQTVTTQGDVPANYGNVIDWTSATYTQTGVPRGYHYAQGAELRGRVQPTETIVGTNNLTETIYVVGDPQSVTVTHSDMQGDKLTATSSAVITGVTGQTVTLPQPDDVAGYVATGNATFNGQSVMPGDAITLTPDKNEVNFTYQMTDYGALATEEGVHAQSAAVEAKRDAAAASSYASEAGSYAANAQSSGVVATDNAVAVTSMADANKDNALIKQLASDAESAVVTASSAGTVASSAVDRASSAALSASSAAIDADSAAKVASDAVIAAVTEYGSAIKATKDGDASQAAQHTVNASMSADQARQAAGAASAADQIVADATRIAEEQDSLASSAARVASEAADLTIGTMAKASSVADGLRTSHDASDANRVASSAASVATYDATQAGSYASEAGSYAGNARASHQLASSHAQSIVVIAGQNGNNADLISLASAVGSAANTASSAHAVAVKAASDASDAALAASSAASVATTAAGHAASAVGGVTAELVAAIDALNAGDSQQAQHHADAAKSAASTVQQAASDAVTASEQVRAATTVAEQQDSLASSAAQVASAAAELNVDYHAKATCLAADLQTSSAASDANQLAMSAASAAQYDATQAGKFASEAGSYAGDANASRELASARADSVASVAAANGSSAELNQLASTAGSAANTASSASAVATKAASDASVAAKQATQAASGATSAANVVAGAVATVMNELRSAASAANAGDVKLAGSYATTAVSAASLAQQNASAAVALRHEVSGATQTVEQQDSLASSAAKVASEAAELTATQSTAAALLADELRASDAASNANLVATSAASGAQSNATRTQSYASEAASYAGNASASHQRASEIADSIAAITGANGSHAELDRLASLAGSAANAASSANAVATQAASDAADAAKKPRVLLLTRRPRRGRRPVPSITSSRKLPPQLAPPERGIISLLTVMRRTQRMRQARRSRWQVRPLWRISK